MTFMQTNLQPEVAFGQQLIRVRTPNTMQPMVVSTDSVKSDFARRLNEAIAASGRAPADKRNWRSWLANRYQVSVESARKWLVGEAIPDTARLGAIAIDLGVSIDRLLTGRVPARKVHADVAGINVASQVRESAGSGAYVRFPLLEGFAGAGAGMYVSEYPEVVEFVEVAQEWARTNLRVPFESIRVLTAHGDSMRGAIEDGDLLFVDFRVKSYDADGVYVFRRHGRVQVKRLQLLADGRLRLKSANDAYDPVDVASSDIEVGGRVLATWTLRRF